MSLQELRPPQQVSCKWCNSVFVVFKTDNKITIYGGKKIDHAYDYYECRACKKTFRTVKQLADEILLIKGMYQDKDVKKMRVEATPLWQFWCPKCNQKHAIEVGAKKTVEHTCNVCDYTFMVSARKAKN